MDDGMNFCAAMAPSWADEIRHPDMHATEFWRRISVIHSEDFDEDVPICLVQNGPGAQPEIAIGGIRFTVPEGRAYFSAVGEALKLVDDETSDTDRSDEPPAGQ